jgi:hypothetical protein
VEEYTPTKFFDVFVVILLNVRFCANREEWIK